MNEPDQKDLDDLQQHLVEVGLICSQWSYLEWLLELTVWWLLGLLNKRTEGRVLTGSFSIDMMARKVCELAHLRISDQADLAILESTRDRIAAVLDERNLAVHGLRQLDPETKFVTAEIARGNFKNRPQPLSLVRLASLNVEINRIALDLQPLLVRLGILEGNLHPISQPGFPQQ